MLGLALVVSASGCLYASIARDFWPGFWPAAYALACFGAGLAASILFLAAMALVWLGMLDV